MQRLILAASLCFAASAPLFAADPLPPASTRYADAAVQEVPSFRRHVVPLFGRLGCNGRACHGSFQGRGGFRLSLFGYDFKLDHDNLTAGDKPRTNKDNPAESLFLQKPTLTVDHEGGERMKVDGWEYRLLKRWVEDGAKSIADKEPELVRLEVTPQEILFDAAGKQVQMHAVAHWQDGTVEDVTPLCRFQSNNDTIAEISESGLVTAAEPGDTHIVVFYDRMVEPVEVIRPLTDKVGPQYPEVPTPTEVDRLIVNKLKKLGVVPSDLCTDAEFLRRASLDITGTLPTAPEVEAFLADTSSDKRSKKVDELLERPAYAAWWTTWFCDITGNSDDELVNTTPKNGQASQVWYDWIHKRVQENKPYDEIVAGILLAKSRSEGQSYEQYAAQMSDVYRDASLAAAADMESMPHFWARRNVRQPEEKALSVAHTFLGIRIECAQCHKHPFDTWTQDDYKQFTNFFTRVGYGVAPSARKDRVAMLESLGLADKKGGDLRREIPKLLEEGKTIPIDEVFVTPLPPNAKKLAEQAAAEAGAEPKKKPKKNEKKQNNRRPQAPLHARIPGGETVNLTEFDDPRDALMDWLRSEDNPLFAHAFVNRVWASYFNVGIVNPPDDLNLANPPSNRALIDYLAQGFVDHDYDMKWLHREIVNSRAYQMSWKPNETNTLDERNFSHSIPRRLPAEVAYDAIHQATASDAIVAKLATNLDGRAISIPGAGRRGGQKGRQASYALTVFGRSTRSNNCDCDRSNEASLLQTVYLRNDNELFTAIDRPRDGWIGQIGQSLGIVSEQPTAEAENSQGAKKRLAALTDRLEKQERRLQRLKAENKKPEEIELLEKKLEQMRADVAKADKVAKRAARRAKMAEQPPEPMPNATASVDPAVIVKQAYLRTLSRYPTQDEAARSITYLNESPNAYQGLRGLMWALLNTKEFIVNH